MASHISEEQFAKMTQGTIHEGKYNAPGNNVGSGSRGRGNNKGSGKYSARSTSKERITVTQEDIARGVETGIVRLTIKVLIWRIMITPATWVFALFALAVGWHFFFGFVYHWSRFPNRSRWMSVVWGMGSSTVICGAVFAQALMR